MAVAVAHLHLVLSTFFTITFCYIFTWVELGEWSSDPMLCEVFCCAAGLGIAIALLWSDCMAHSGHS